jgi:tetratricopeptide (TPR) repeat protein
MPPSATGRFRTSWTASVVLMLGVHALLLFIPSPAGAQAQAECATSDCPDQRLQAPPAQRQLWLDAAAAHQLKLRFVEALQRFTRAQAGTFGDEGADLRPSVDAMREALVRWDTAIREFQTRATRLAAGADVHVALATVFLDRQRVADALRELDAASRDDNRRLDVHTLRALAYTVSDRPADAARALRTAATIDADNPTVFYALAQYAARANRPEEAQEALRGFLRALRVRGASGARGAGATPFERVDLLRQVAGVAPVFPQARYGDGFQDLAKGDYPSAVARLADAVALDPLVGGDAVARNRRVRAASLLRQGQLLSAVQLLERTLPDAPNDAETHRLLGLAYWMDEQRGRTIEHLRAAVRLAPGDDRARVALANVLLDDGRAAEAERALTETIEIGLASGQVHYQLGLLYQRQALLPQAAQHFDQAARFGPIVGRDHFYQTIGSLRVNQSDFDGAVAAYSRRVDANPNGAEAHRQLGEIYFLQGRHDEALLEFTTAAWLAPGEARAHAAAGQVYVRTLKYAEAIAAFERALALDDALREARYGLATSLMRLGRVAEAKREMATFDRLQAQASALGQHEFQLDAIRREAARSLIAGAHERAVALFAEALLLDPGTPRSHSDLGIALLRMRRAAEAIEHLEAAKRLEPIEEVLGPLADAYAAVGNLEESSRHRMLRAELVQRRKIARIRALAQ